MKLTTITQLTLDGVTQGNGGSSDRGRAGRIHARRLGARRGG